MANEARMSLRQEIIDNLQEIERLQQLNINLVKKSMLISDDTQWYEEKEEEKITGRGANRNRTIQRVARVYWKEYFKDEANGSILELNRSRVVKVDDDWTPFAIHGFPRNEKDNTVHFPNRKKEVRSA